MGSAFALPYRQQMLIDIPRAEELLKNGFWFKCESVIAQFPLPLLIDNPLFGFLLSVLIVDSPLFV